jgi:transcriptional regulator with XRE-family HTH domain
MALSMGRTIKQLRKAHNLTQEELAEKLNVTYQAVSKWENESGMPDISQVVPLACVFGVSTDVLFGTYSTTDQESAASIIEVAGKLNPNKETPGKIVWDALQDGLQRHPSSLMLQQASLEYGMSLAYPANDCHDAAHATEIYKECVRQANIIIAHSKEATDVLRAKMIIVMLHSAYGQRDKAREYADTFPWRCDMTAHIMHAYIAHDEKDYESEALHCRRDIMFHYEAMFCSIAQLGEAYTSLGKYDEALQMYESIFAFINILFGGETLPPPAHIRERGDVHALMAKTYIAMGNKDMALTWLEKMVTYDTEVRSKFTDRMSVKSPFVRDTGSYFYHTHGSNRQKLLRKLNSVDFDAIKNEPRYAAMLDRANKMAG